MNHRPLTKAEEKAILDTYESGESIRTAARVAGVGRQRAERLLHARGLVRSPAPKSVSPELLRILLEKRDEGYTTADLAILSRERGEPVSLRRLQVILSMAGRKPVIHQIPIPPKPIIRDPDAYMKRKMAGRVFG